MVSKKSEMSTKIYVMDEAALIGLNTEDIEKEFGLTVTTPSFEHKILENDDQFRVAGSMKSVQDFLLKYFPGE